MVLTAGTLVLLLTIPQTAGERYSDTVEFFPATVPMPQPWSADAATQAIRDLLQALKNPHPATMGLYGYIELLRLQFMK
mgnify:CR=1 FL=1